MTDVWKALEATSFATAVRTSGSLFPWIECVHVLAIVLVVGTISIIDLRLLGFTSRARGVRRVVEEVLPYTWGAFAAAVVSGFLMFASSATTYAVNIHFQLKMVLLLLAAANMVVFHLLPYRSVHLWDELTTPPVRARLCGALSLACWVGVVLMGRWIGFSNKG